MVCNQVTLDLVQLDPGKVGNLVSFLVDCFLEVP